MKGDYITNEELLVALGYEPTDTEREEALLDALDKCYYTVRSFIGCNEEIRLYDDESKAKQYVDDISGDVHHGEYVELHHNGAYIVKVYG